MAEGIKFNYLHRDSGNWKKFGSVKFSNPERLSPEEIEKKICQNLIAGVYFYPEEAGIKKFKFHRFSDDCSWYEFESVEVIERCQNKKSRPSISEFCAGLEKMKNPDFFLMGDQPTTCPICGTRTDIYNELNSIQLHHCPFKECNFRFLVEEP